MNKNKSKEQLYFEEKTNSDKEYINSLLEKYFFDETFNFLEEKATLIPNPINRAEYINEILSFIFNNEHFDFFLDTDTLHLFSQSFIKKIQQCPLFVDKKEQLNLYIEKDKLSVMFSLLLQNNSFKELEYLKKFVDTDLSGFPKTLKKIAKSNNENSLHFICNNMENIHFYHDELLRIYANSQPKLLKILIEQYHFDLNKYSNHFNFNASLLSILIEDENLENFNFIIQNYGHLINFNNIQEYNKDYFSLINSSRYSLEFYKILLTNPHLSSEEVNKITKWVFTTATSTAQNINSKNITKANDSGLMDALFSHPSFNPQMFDFQQRYIIYGLLGTMVNCSQSPLLSKEFGKALLSYIKNNQEKSIPNTKEFHILGATIEAILATKKSSDIHDNYQNGELRKIKNDILTEIIKKYPQYINQPNPNGLLPIMQVEINSEIYEKLVSSGAVPLEEDTCFWKSIFRFGKKKHIINQEALAKAQQSLLVSNQPINNQSTNTSTFHSLRIKIKEDFNSILPLIKNPLCAPTIKFKCENMLLKTDKLIQIMEKHQIQDTFEEIFFLNENFSNYLKKSLQLYINLCQTTNELTTEKEKQNKLEKAQLQCEQQVDLLTEQLQLITENIFSHIEQGASTNLKVQGRYLKEKMNELQKNNIFDERQNPEPTLFQKKFSNNLLSEKNTETGFINEDTKLIQEQEDNPIVNTIPLHTITTKIKKSSF